MAKAALEAGWAVTVRDLEILNNPSEADLRTLSAHEEKKTEFGAPAYYTQQAASRSAGSTYVAGSLRLGRLQRESPPDMTAEALRKVALGMPAVQWMTLDRMLGQAPEASFHCRLLIPRAYARVALMWSKLLFPADSARHDLRRNPDFLTVFFPNWLGDGEERGPLPKRLILIQPEEGVTFVLGTDYVGEAKMSFLRQAMYRVKSRGGLGLHAGSKSIRVTAKDRLKDCGMLLFGLSGTGKTTLTLADHGLSEPEEVTVLQDDIVLWTKDGTAFGTENNFYAKTEGLRREDQPGLYQALLSPESVFENVAVGPDGKVNFTDYLHGTNGRALVLRSRIPHTSRFIDLDRVDKLIFITRRDTIVPPVARLSPEQAAAFFMLGESIETSAGDPARAGQPKHEVGFNPFIIGPEEDEGNRLLELLRAHPKTEAYLLNTGSVGKESDVYGGDPRGLKITREVSSHLLAFIARQEPRIREGWTTDRDWKYEVPTDVKDIPLWKSYGPKRHYKPSTYARLTREMREERRSWLGQFPGLRKEIRDAI